MNCKKYLLGSFIFVVFIFMGCQNENPVSTTATDLNLKSSIEEIEVPGQLTEQEIAGLIYARQIEKVARDVYYLLYATWGEPFIANIILSEQKHMDAIKRMLTKYSIEDPVVDDGVGQFTDPYFTDMFNDLLALGTASEQGAKEAGLIIENACIAYLEHELSYITVENLVNVYTNLLRGSNRHLLEFLEY